MDDAASGVARAPLAAKQEPSAGREPAPTEAPVPPVPPPSPVAPTAESQPSAARPPLSAAREEVAAGKGLDAPPSGGNSIDLPRMARSHHDVPPPGARMPRHIHEPKPTLGTLPPGGRRATSTPPLRDATQVNPQSLRGQPDATIRRPDVQASVAGVAGNAGVSGAAGRQAASTLHTAQNQAAAPAAAGGTTAKFGRRAEDQAAAAAGPAAGAAVWSARQGGGERVNAGWATPVGATSHPEFNPTPTSIDGWPADGEEPPQVNSKVKSPVLWGVVLLIAAALTCIALWIKGNVATERDLAALARIAHLPAMPAEVAAPAVAPRTPQTPVPATQSDQAAAQLPPAAAPASPPAPLGEKVGDVAPNTVAATPRTVQPIEAGPPPATQAAAPVRQQSRQAPVQVRRAPQQPARNFTGAPQSSDNAIARMSPRAKEYLYSRVFRRCPAPGAPGALQCRKHICNGAEGRSPACYHINRLNL
ncbi:hypothetical protein ACHMW6_15780 [Pseudoduganella sp. UC29_106]|uniref:hypothetical protein n=1 Tax=Pseudoduganella sp. UC29_106 TaxID=3374553 RepID=UPI0037568B85